MKHKISYLVFALTLAGCGPIDDVRNSSGSCTNEFKAAYNALTTEFEKLEVLTVPAEKTAQLEVLDLKCTEFFEKYSDQVECEASREQQARTVKEIVKGDDFSLICSDPELGLTRVEIPEPIE